MQLVNVGVGRPACLGGEQWEIDAAGLGQAQ